MSTERYLGQFGEGELCRALERFEWLAEEMRDQVHAACAETLQQVLIERGGRVAAKERALVTLGLMGSAHAEAALAWFDSAGAHPRVRLLHRLARRECARRRRVRTTQRESTARRAA